MLSLLLTEWDKSELRMTVHGILVEQDDWAILSVEFVDSERTRSSRISVHRHLDCLKQQA